MTARDMQVFEFLREFKAARTSVVAALFFDGKLRVAQRRLQALHDEKPPKVHRANGREYIYYTKMPRRLNHALAVTDFLGHLARTHSLSEIRAEYKCGCVQADATAVIDGRPAFIEVQLTGPADIVKYLKLRASKEWKAAFETFPDVWLLCDRAPKECGIVAYATRTQDIRLSNVC